MIDFGVPETAEQHPDIDANLLDHLNPAYIRAWMDRAFAVMQDAICRCEDENARLVVNDLYLVHLFDTGTIIYDKISDQRWILGRLIEVEQFSVSLWRLEA